MIFLIDESPGTLVPPELLDYNARFIARFLFEPLFYEEKDEYKAQPYIEDLSHDTSLILEVRDKYWSNGELLTVQDIYNCLKYIVQYKTPFATYLDFIVGVKEYLQGTGSLADVQISIQQNRIVASTLHLYSYKELFSTVEFAPFKTKDGIPITGITSGKFQLISQSEDEIVLENSEQLNIKFVVDYSSQSQIELVKNNQATYTATTSLTYEDLSNHHLLDDTGWILPIFYRIILPQKFVTNNHKILISNRLLTTLSAHQELQHMIQIQSHNDDLVDCKINNLKSEYRIVFPNYYPNDLLVEKIANVLKSMEITTIIKPLTLHQFIDYQPAEQDILLELVTPLIHNKLDYFIEKINKINNSYIAEYLDDLNMWISTNFEDNNLELRMETLIQKYSAIISVGQVRSFYIKSDDAPELVLDSHGVPAQEFVNQIICSNIQE